MDQTVVHVACSQGDVDAAVLLLANGYSESAADANGDTPLHYAVKVGVIRNFVPMHNRYIQNQHADIVRLLLCTGADHRKRNFAGVCALDVDSSYERTCSNVHLALASKSLTFCSRLKTTASG